MCAALAGGSYQAVVMQQQDGVTAWFAVQGKNVKPAQLYNEAVIRCSPVTSSR